MSKEEKAVDWGELKDKIKALSFGDDFEEEEEEVEEPTPDSEEKDKETIKAKALQDQIKSMVEDAGMEVEESMLDKLLAQFTKTLKKETRRSASEFTNADEDMGDEDEDEKYGVPDPWRKMGKSVERDGRKPKGKTLSITLVSFGTRPESKKAFGAIDADKKRMKEEEE